MYNDKSLELNRKHFTGDAEIGIFSKQLLYYYLILYVLQIILLSFLNVDPFYFQYVYTLAIFIPLLFRTEFTPFVYALFFVTDQYYITENTFLISGNKIYTLFFIVLIYGLIRRSKQLISLDYLFIFLFIIYIFIIDRVNQIIIFENSYFLNLSLLLILYPFINNKISFSYMNLGLILSSLVISISFIVVFLQKGHQYYGIGFSDGGFRDANYMSSVIGVGYILSLFHIFGLFTNNILKRTIWPYYLFASIAIFAIILSGSRGGFLSAVIVSIIILFIKKKGKSIGGNFLFVTFISFVFYFLMQFGFFDLLLYRFFEEGSLDSGSGRTIILDELMTNFNNLSLQHKLFGGGYGFFSNLTYGMDPHNDFATLLTSYGIFGLILFVLMILRLIFPFKKAAYLILIYFILVSLTISSFKTFAMPLFLLIGLKVKDFSKIGI